MTGAENRYVSAFPIGSEMLRSCKMACTGCLGPDQAGRERGPITHEASEPLADSVSLFRHEARRLRVLIQFGQHSSFLNWFRKMRTWIAAMRLF
jgi:hypothetical protein